MKCCITGCDNEMTCPGSGTCINCYQSILRWSKRSPEDVLNRSKKIGLYTARMQTLTPSNLSIMNPKKIKLKGIPGQIRIKPKTMTVKKKVRNGAR